jgi:DNA-binding Lrp family transcriptional regulator
VRDSLSRLEQHQVIRRAALFNVSRLGFVEYDLMCSLGSLGRAKKQELLSYLLESPLVTFVLETAGEYHLIIVVCAASPAVVESFITSVSDHFGDIFNHIDIAVMHSRAIYGIKFLATKKRPEKFVRICSERGIEKYDQLDRRILKALARDAGLSLRTLAANLGVPHSTLGFRVKQLKQSGVLLGSFWSFNSAALGLSEFRLHLALRGLSSQVKQRTFEYACVHPNITFSIQYLGKWQYCFGIVAEDTARASQIVSEVESFLGPSLAQASLFPVVGVRKVELFPMFDDQSGTELVPKTQQPLGMISQ